jgi:hypothetical protein
MLASRKAETENVDRKVTPKVTKMINAEGDKRWDEMKSQMAQLMSAVSVSRGANKRGKGSNSNGKENKQKSGGPSDSKVESDQKRSEDFTDLEKFEKKNWLRGTRCYKCSGYGHISRFCASRLNGQRGERRPSRTASPAEKKAVNPTQENSESTGANSPQLD